jgi:hypothetical protein
MDVHDPARGLFGRCEVKISNQAFDALVEQVMTNEPYASAQRVFWVVDNGTIHRGEKPSPASKAPGPTSCSCISRAMPRGSTRSRSTLLAGLDRKQFDVVDRRTKRGFKSARVSMRLRE